MLLSGAALNNDEFCLIILSMWIGSAIVLLIYWVVFTLEAKR